MTQQAAKETQANYRPVRVTADPACRIEAFDPSRDLAKPLFEAGLGRMGINRLRGHFSAGSDCCETHLLHATISGEIVCEAGDKPLRIRKGEMLIAPARGPHRLRMTKQPCTVAWIHIRQTPQWEFLQAMGRHVQRLIDPEGFRRVMEAILRASRAEERSGAELLHHYAEILLILLSRELEHQHSPTDREVQIRLQQLWDVVRDDPASKWSLPVMAKRVGISRGYLPGICRRLFGVTPMQKVTFIRMEKAQDLLRMTSLTLSEVAGRVGYQTEFAFSDAFERVNRCRPGAFRRSREHRETKLSSAG